MHRPVILAYVGASRVESVVRNVPTAHHIVDVPAIAPNRLVQPWRGDPVRQGRYSKCICQGADFVLARSNEE